MTATLEITLDDTETRAALDAIRRKMADLSPVWDEIGSALVSATQRRFETGVGPDGREWKKSARAEAEGGQTLVDGNRLRTSLTYTTDHDGATVGSNLIYAGVHQHGGIVKAKSGGKLKFKIGGKWVAVSRVDIPARPYLGLDADDKAEILAILNDYLREAAS